MDDPAAFTQSGSTATAARKARALVSGEMLSIADEPFLVRAESIDLARDLVRLVGGFPAATPPQSASLSLLKAAPECPARQPDEHYGYIELWRDGDRLWLRHDSGFTGWASTQELVVGGSGEVSEPLRRLFLPLLTHVLAHRDIFVVHGGAADAGGGAMLFLGATGSGKSSLVGLSLTRQWQILGDDMVALKPDGDEVTVIGIPRPPAIPAGALLNDFGNSEPLDGRGRIHLDPGILDREPRSLIGSVLPFRAMNGERHVSDVEGIDLFHELIGSFPAASNQELLRRFLPTAVAVAQLPAYLLPLASEGKDRFIDAGLRLDAVAAQLPHALQ